MQLSRPLESTFDSELIRTIRREVALMDDKTYATTRHASVQRIEWE